MDRNFARALAAVRKHEGGWADHPADPGGATMKGVTLENFRRYVKPGGTKADLRQITDDQVAVVFRRFYWDAVLGAELPDGVDFATFDFAVNSGPSRAAKYLQAVVGAVVDGKVGPATLKAVREKPAASVINDLCDRRMAFLRKLPTWGTFGKGWASRVKDVRAKALAMASQPLPAKPTKDTEVLTVPGPKPDQTAVVIIDNPKNPPQPPSVKPPKRTNGIISLFAIILAALAAALKYFGG